MSLETEINIPRYMSDIVEVGIWHYYYVKDVFLVYVSLK